MTPLVEILISGIDIGMCAGHLFPDLLEQPTMIALHLAIASVHCVASYIHFRKRRHGKQ